MAIFTGVELRHLRYFSMLAETLNFSRAAERLHVTQPALSRQIRDLEEELGVTLIERGAGENKLTPTGKKFLAGARQLLTAAETLVSGVHQKAGKECPPLRLAVFGSLMADRIAPFVRAMVRRHPGLHFAIEEAVPVEALRDLRLKKLDAVFSGEPEPARLRGLESRVVWITQHDILLPANHRLAKRRSVALSELRDERWCIWDDRVFPGFGRYTIKAFRAAGFRPEIAGYTDSLTSTLMHVAAGDYISNVPPIARKLPHPGVVFVPTDPPEAMEIPVLLVWRPDSPHAEPLRWLAKAIEAALAVAPVSDLCSASQKKARVL
ncbi:MAG: LysR family transcriptional regulator [Nibricoccus sp.]